MRDARQVEHRVVVGMRIEAGVIAERSLAAALARLDVAFEHDLGVRRHLEVDRDALDELDALAAEKAREHQLVEPLGHRRGRGIRRARDRGRARRPPAAACPAARRRDSAARHLCGAASACPSMRPSKTCMR